MSSEAEKPESGARSPGFTVTDRRSFTEEGEVRSGSAGAQAGSRDEAALPVEPPSGDQAAGAPSGATRGSRRLPPVDFPTFVLSLGSSALMHLGEAPHPGSGASEKDLPLAKHSIDILTMLQEKTRGNLTPPEAQLLENLLYDLRLRYVEVAKK